MDELVVQLERHSQLELVEQILHDKYEVLDERVLVVMEIMV